MSTDYEINECQCPKCHHEHTHDRLCNDCGGEGSTDDMYDEDPMWYEPGTFLTCSECNGSGHEHWCPKCGYNLSTNPEGLKIESIHDEMEHLP